MDRLNEAAVSKVSNVLELYSASLAGDISKSYGISTSDIEQICKENLEMFLNDYNKVLANSTCAWFTKRGEPCHKERRPGSDFCSVHAEYFLLHTEEIAKAKNSSVKVNVTRKGIQKVL